MSPFIRVSVAVLASYGAGLVGFLFVDTHVSGWYATLVRPSFTPPDSVFAIVWLILYAFMAMALAIIWTRDPRISPTQGWVRFYFLQLLFNAAWTMFFFGLHAVLTAFVDILFLGFVLICLVVGAWEIDRRAAYLLLPYLAWVIFAGYLTLGIWLLN